MGARLSQRWNRARLARPSRPRPSSSQGLLGNTDWSDSSGSDQLYQLRVHDIAVAGEREVVVSGEFWGTLLHQGEKIQTTDFVYSDALLVKVGW